MLNALLFAGLLSGLAAHGHELRPTIVTATIDKSGTIELELALNLEALMAGISPVHEDTAGSMKAPVYDRLRATPPGVLVAAFKPFTDEMRTDLHLAFDGTAINLEFHHLDIPSVGDVAIARNSKVFFYTTIPTGSTSFTWKTHSRFGETVIRAARKGEKAPYFSAFLAAGESSSAIALNSIVKQSAWSGFVQYMVTGFTHILPKGLDHILFIVSLFLLSPYFRPLLWQVTSFTVAHSVTLGLGIYGLVSVPPAIVEPLIALSIAFVAIENLFTDRLRRSRPAVVFGFGLLHGLGFAGVLSEVGLPQAQFATALIAFNVGVELGQIAILTFCFVAVGLRFRDRYWYRPAFAMPASLAVACVATYWVIERIA